VLNSISTSAEQSIRIAGARAKVLLLQRKYRELLLEAENIPDALFATMPGALADKYNAIGFARKELRDEAGAQGAFLKAKSIVEAHLKHRPDDADGHAHLATLLAWLWDKEAALAEAQRATELCPESKDAVGGPEITAKVAKVYAILGNSARAIEILDGLLSRPGSVTVQGLKSNPFWDRLRNDPRFDALLDKYSNKT
jgi:tetratricopeptide (TPR) repeat protein